MTDNGRPKHQLVLPPGVLPGLLIAAFIAGLLAGWWIAWAMR